MNLMDKMFDDVLEGLDTLGGIHSKAYNKVIDSVIDHQDIKNERGSRYGSFDTQVYGVSTIVDAMVHIYMMKHNELPPMKNITEWHYLAIKLARIPADVNYVDNYTDLSIYSKLLEEDYNGSKLL